MSDIKVDNKIVKRKIPDLAFYEKNSRTHSDEQVRQIAESITEFTFINPVLIDENKKIIAGHGRVMAAELLEMKDVPTLMITGLTDAQRKALVIADNKLALNAGWNVDILLSEIDDLIEEDFNVEILGFSEAELENLRVGWDSDIEDPKEPEDPGGFKVTIKGENELDEEDVRETIRRALEESGIEGVQVK